MHSAVSRRIVVVGASLAGLRAAETVRGLDFDGELVVVGAEAHRPYDRPPLSKQVLTGAWEPERTALRRPEVFDELGVQWRLATTATTLDLTQRSLAIRDGAGDEHLGFDGLIIATGASPRRLPGVLTATLSAAGPLVTELRTLDDSVRLRERLANGDQRVVVIGAGFIGLEVAAAARTLGNDVVVIEGAEAPLIRGLGAEMGRAVTACHGDHGVEIRCSTTVAAITDEAVVVESNGHRERLGADVVVVGIGVAANTAWLASSGLRIDDGVVADEFLCCGVPSVYAAGDVVRWPNALFGETMRVEHWSNAAEQGAAAARNLLAQWHGDEREPYSPVPFFWSDQYDRRVQFLGRASADDEVQIVRGSVAERQFVALYGRAGRLRGVLGLNSPKQVMPLRKLLERGADVAEAVAALSA